MENKPKRSKALIITIILVLALLLIGYLLFKNVKNSSSSNFFSRIFSSLSPSSNAKTEKVQAGENISKGDSVTGAGTASDGSKVVVKARNGSTILGVANENIENGGFGEIIVSSSGINNFFDSFSGFLDDLFGGNSGENGGLGTGDGSGIGTTGGGIGTGGGEIGGGTGGEITTTTECNDKIDNDNDIKIDVLDPECHVDGDLEKEYLPNHNSESSIGGGDEDKTIPDLMASAVTPTSTTVNTLTTITTLVSNSGESSTEKSFYTFFTITNITSNDTQIETENTNVSKSKIKIFISKIIDKIPWVSTKKTIAEESVEENTLIPPLQGESTSMASIFYTFDQAGTYYIRACADKSGASDVGVVEESNEENNCGPWTTFIVSDSLPTGGDITTGDDEITTGDEIGDDTVVNPGEENKCLLVEQNPLEFTDEEKAGLEILLRKFYLISSTLRTTDDIVTIYDDIERYKDFMNQTDNLISQCYQQVNPLMSAGFGWVRHGNPWYTKTTGGTFPYTSDNFGYTNYNWLDGNYSCDESGHCSSLMYKVGEKTLGPGCKVVTGYYYGTWTETDSEGKTIGKYDCDSLNDPNDYDCWDGMKTRMTGGDDGPDQYYLEKGCKWKEGVYMEDTERILKIW